MTSPEPTELLPPIDEPERRGGWLWPAFAVIAIAVLGWLSLDTRNAVNDLRGQLVQRLSDADNAIRQTQATADEAVRETREGLAKLSLLENKLAESQNQQVALEALYQELSRSRDEVSLAEIEDVLELASQQLQLAGNVKAALIALQAVDARLARAENKTRWTQLRQALNKDMERLRALPFVDTVALSARLDNLITAVDNLPLRSDPVDRGETVAPTAVDPEPRLWVRAGHELLRDLGKLVRIRNLEKAEVPLLGPGQAYFLRENLKLRLLQARLALLARSEASYKVDLKQAGEWLAEYFDPQISAVTAARTTVRQLAESPISISPPDISESLAAVRAARTSRDRPAR